jgi:uncharacterized damage-inducible protein DinB
MPATPPSPLGTHRPVGIDVSTVAIAADDVLRQAVALLQTLSDHHFTAPSKVLPAGTVGKHMRHILDHYAAPLHAAAAGAGDPTPIDYDHRQRDTTDETHRQASIDRAVALRNLLALRTPADEERPVRIRVMLAADGTEALLTTTLGRELAFAAHHAQHHLAMIAAICREHGQTVPADLGKAPSTVNHERSK